MKRAIALLLCLLTLFSAVLIPIGALEDKTANFSKNYPLTGVYGTDMVAIAAAQDKKVKKDLGYTEEWCADFVSDCARLAGVPQFPYNAGCTGLRRALLAWGGIWHDSKYYDSSTDYIPQKGDIVFFSSTSTKESNGCDHVGLIYESGYNSEGRIYTVEGNTKGKDAAGNKSDSCVAIKTRPMTPTSDSTLYVMGYVTINGGPDDNPDNHTPPTRTLSYNGTFPGGNPDDVIWVQKVLYQLGYLKKTSDIDGLYGSGCTTTIKDFQEDHGLEVDGACGTQTTTALKEAWLQYKKDSCHMELQSDRVSVPIGFVTKQTVTFQGKGVTELSVRSSNLSVCMAELPAVDLEAGEAAVELHGLAVGTATVTLQMKDRLGNVLLTKKITVTVSDAGDINGDKRIDAADLTMLLRYLAKIDTTVPTARGDVNGDGHIDAADATALARLLEEE